MSDYREVETTEHEQGREQRVATFKVTQLIWLLLGILEALIALRVVFKLIGVNAANPFASLLYNVTEIFVAPFASLIGAPAAGGMVLEISSILAMFIYLLIGWALERIVYVLFYRPRGPVSVRQTTIAEHTPQQAPPGVSQTTTTDRITTQAPTGTSQTTTTERTNTPPDSR
ncbi:predicted integral membrane protein [Longilinea arvoryzae]|uniref:Predicted integral membrane protein n=1 Tax=Longilinea arvoryzae TaxID=360412 RepID=A0A0S7B8C2_9CHLR|nr:YggT family protein [Longilinea arvoryzae]GAP13591.1 predicted integral membrane protein [Longilinea arvoryzae]